MNEPTPPGAVPPAPAQDGPVGSFGAAVRAAREKAGMSVPDLAARLRLHVKQVEALERCDLQALPTLIYVRGFLRSCARELKLDPGPLLEDLNRRSGVGPSTLEGQAVGSFRLARFGDGSKSIIGFAILALVLAGLVGILVPRRQSAPAAPVVPETPASAPNAVEKPTAAPAAPVADATSGPALAPVVALEAVPRSGAPQESAATPEMMTVGAATSAVGITTAAPTSASRPVAEAPGKTPNEEQLPAPPSHTAGPAALVLRIRSEAWIEVVQSDGATLLSQICAAGTVQTIKGMAPLRVVVGNSAGVEVQFRGAAVDLGRYTNPNGVARLTLE